MPPGATSNPIDPVFAVNAGRKIQVEVCVDSLDSSLAAQAAGADRVELCANLLEGGTTPSSGLIAEVRRNISMKLHVMVRPRGGDFCYTGDEFQIMQLEIAAAKGFGADGVVLGILTAEGLIDEARMRTLIDHARPMKVTCHRAIDMSRDLRKSLETLIGLGVDYVLTSGGRQTAPEGSVAIARLVRAAKGRIRVIAGSGINERNVRRVIAETHVTEIHVGLSDAVPGPMKYRNTKISMGKVKGREYTRFSTSQTRLAALIAAI
ncbi:MAG TPA: copper homeostasis protein CutC [Candidatus Acidoferrum sp.]|nr:copper homeostasis protein CutC [Candidatus Acidoferrum sp.]